MRHIQRSQIRFGSTFAGKGILIGCLVGAAGCGGPAQDAGTVSISASKAVAAEKGISGPGGGRGDSAAQTTAPVPPSGGAAAPAEPKAATRTGR